MRSISLALAGLTLVGSLALAAPQEAVLVVWDSRQARGAQAFKELVELLKRQRAQGHFVGYDVDPSFRVYDFAVAEHAHSLKSLGVGQPVEPFVCLTRVNGRGIPSRLTWRAPVRSAQQAMGALDQRLGIGVASPSPVSSASPVASPSPVASASPIASPSPVASASPVASPSPLASPPASPSPLTATVPVDSMPSGNSLAAGMFLESSNRLYRLVGQTDGNFVVYKLVGDRLERIWDTDTGGQDRRLCLERTGRLQVLTEDERSLWHSPYQGIIGQYRLHLQDDGDLVVEQRRGQEWTFCWSSVRGSEGAWTVPPGMRLDRRRGR